MLSTGIYMAYLTIYMVHTWYGIQNILSSDWGNFALKETLICDFHTQNHIILGYNSFASCVEYIAPFKNSSTIVRIFECYSEQNQIWTVALAMTLDHPKY